VEGEIREGGGGKKALVLLAQIGMSRNKEMP
jgi:hypothetical protein